MLAMDGDCIIHVYNCIINVSDCIIYIDDLTIHATNCIIHFSDCITIYRRTKSSLVNTCELVRVPLCSVHWWVDRGLGWRFVTGCTSSARISLDCKHN